MSTAVGTRIVVLDEQTANQIAAGEVIERPASVVKELVENSIDAAATRVLVELEEGGKRLIRVADNGCGMAREDAVLSLQRHATSKIRSADDLFAIGTLGFRGEALPSIASVSHLEMVSKRAEDASGVRLRVEGGTIQDLEEVGAPQGTVVTVRDLFFNTPARLKFLKSSATELNHIVDLMGRFALAHPSISFRLMHRGRELFSAPASGSLFNALLAVFGRDTAKDLMPISFEAPALKVQGYVSKPSLTRANRAHQFFFVNRRSIRSKTITHAVDEAFRGLLTPARYPVAVVFVEIDPAMVDVNVHPTKAEVKFSREGEVHSAVHRAIKEALSGSGSIPAVLGADSSHDSSGSEAVPSGTGFGGARSTHPAGAQGGPGRDELLRRQGKLIRPHSGDAAAFHEAIIERAYSGAPPDQVDPFSWDAGTAVVGDAARGGAAEPASGSCEMVSLAGLRVIGQFKNTYILAESEHGLLLIDQHVAHERVLYDKMTLGQEKEPVEMQRLIVPATVSLGRRESLLVNQKLSDFRRVGYELEWFGKDSFVIRAVAASLAQKDYIQVLRDMVDELVELTVSRHLIAKQEQVLITGACKMAVKAGDVLSAQEMSKLVDELLQSSNPFMCPHGRPIIVTVSGAEISRRFRR